MKLNHETLPNLSSAAIQDINSKDSFEPEPSKDNTPLEPKPTDLPIEDAVTFMFMEISKDARSDLKDLLE